LLISSQVFEVLISEYHNLSLSDQEGEFVEALIGEFRDLNSRDLGTEVRRDVGGLGIGSKEMRLLGVSTVTRIDMSCRELSEKGLELLQEGMAHTEELSRRELLINVEVRKVERVGGALCSQRGGHKHRTVSK